MTLFYVFLTGLIFLTAALTIWGEESGRRNWVYLFKPLTTGLIFLLAVILAQGHFSPYVTAILLGLLFSLAGDVFLMLPGDKFLQGLLSFLLAHLFYIFAFSRGHAFGANWALLIFLAYGILIFAFLYPGLGKMKIPVAVYVLVILTMVWQAWVRFDGLQTAQAANALAGALLFVASDSLLAIDRFRKKLPLARLWILGTSFSAQWLIAISVR